MEGEVGDLLVGGVKALAGHLQDAKANFGIAL